MDGESEQLDVRPSTPLLLRPIHRWFFFWELVVPYVYRVTAVGVAAVLTAVALVWVGVPTIVAAPVSLGVWIALAVMQEHDERVHLPVDAVYLARLRTNIEPLLASKGLGYRGSDGPRRARRPRTETFLYERSDEQEGCIDFWIRRDRRSGMCEIDYGGHDLAEFLRQAGHDDLAEKLSSVGDPEADVDILVEALRSAPPEFWVEP